MAKQSKARRRQLNRVRRLRKSLAERGYILPAEVWDLNSLSTQKLASMTPDWFYRQSEYRVTAQDYAVLLRDPGAASLGIRPGEITSGLKGRYIESRRRYAKDDYSYTGRAWEIIRKAQMRYDNELDPIGANQAANELSNAIAERGIDIVEGHIREMPEEFYRRLDDLVSEDYESLSKTSDLTGIPIRDILEELAAYVREILEAW